MSPLLNWGKKRPHALSEVLSKHLNRSAEGREIIRAFDKDRDAGGTALIEYLNTHLPEYPELQAQIKETLGRDAGEKFTTIVAGGGHVDQIINISELKSLSIQYYVFQNVRQIAAFFLSIVLIGGAIAFGYWWSIQPTVMDGDFNIAVAEFAYKGNANDSQIAPAVSQRIFNSLTGQYMLSSFRDVQVEHDKIGVITDAEQARVLAAKINAHVVIWGDVAVFDGEVLVTPRFYIVESHTSDVGEVNGDHKFSDPIHFPVQDVTNPSADGLKTMQRITTILTEFTKTLVYLEAGQPKDLILAKTSIKEAIKNADSYGDFTGKEVLYLFASDIARRQGKLDQAQEELTKALHLNQQYGRAYIAQANIYYDQRNHYKAKNFYKQAIDIQDKPVGAYLLEKASTGLGNICFVQYEAILKNDPGDPVVTELAQCAIENYGAVIASYKQEPNSGGIARALAAGAYYSSGIVYQDQGKLELARSYYEEALKLTEDPGFKKQIETALQEVTQP